MIDPRSCRNYVMQRRIISLDHWVFFSIRKVRLEPIFGITLKNAKIHLVNAVRKFIANSACQCQKIRRQIILPWDHRRRGVVCLSFDLQVCTNQAIHDDDRRESVAFDDAISLGRTPNQSALIICNPRKARLTRRCEFHCTWSSFKPARAREKNRKQTLPLKTIR